MAEAYIVDAVRTAGGRRGGALKDWHPADMAAEVLDALVERSGIDPAVIDDVIVGCVGQAGEDDVGVLYERAAGIGEAHAASAALDERCQLQSCRRRDKRWGARTTATVHRDVATRDARRPSDQGQSDT